MTPWRAFQAFFAINLFSLFDLGRVVGEIESDNLGGLNITFLELLGARKIKCAVSNFCPWRDVTLRGATATSTGVYDSDVWGMDMTILPGAFGGSSFELTLLFRAYGDSLGTIEKFNVATIYIKNQVSQQRWPNTQLARTSLTSLADRCSTVWISLDLGVCRAEREAVALGSGCSKA